MLQSFFVTFVKQGRIWEKQHALAQPEPALPQGRCSGPSER
jgi:hypothetical protein